MAADVMLNVSEASTATEPPEYPLTHPQAGHIRLRAAKLCEPDEPTIANPDNLPSLMITQSAPFARVSSEHSASPHP